MEAVVWQFVAKKLFVFFAIERFNESNVRAAMESAVSGLQSALTRVSTVVTQLQTGRRPVAEECTASHKTAERSQSDSIHRATGRETAERDSDGDFESRPKKRYNLYICSGYSRLVVLMCKNDSKILCWD